MYSGQIMKIFKNIENYREKALAITNAYIYQDTFGLPNSILIIYISKKL